MSPTPCFACGKKLEAAANHEIMESVPHEGTQFTSSGNYGSTVFDPMNQYELLEVNICDDCLLERRDRVVYLTVRPRAMYDRKEWKP